jgi:hypothetical protein
MAAKDKKQTREFKTGEKYIAFGVVFGTLVGVLTDNIGLWLAIGIAIGVGMAAQHKIKNNEGGETPNKD